MNAFIGSHIRLAREDSISLALGLHKRGNLLEAITEVSVLFPTSLSKAIQKSSSIRRIDSYSSGLPFFLSAYLLAHRFRSVTTGSSKLWRFVRGYRLSLVTKHDIDKCLAIRIVPISCSLDPGPDVPFHHVTCATSRRWTSYVGDSPI